MGNIVDQNKHICPSLKIKQGLSSYLYLYFNVSNNFLCQRNKLPFEYDCDSIPIIWYFTIMWKQKNCDGQKV